MVRCALVTLALALLSLSAPDWCPAQTVSLGARAGVNFADLSGDDVNETDTRTGISVGAFTEISFSDVFAIQPEALWTQKGAGSTLEGDTSVEIQLNYVQVPVLAKVSIPSESSVGAHVLAGPSVAFETSCDVEASGRGGSLSLDCDSPTFDGVLDTKSVEFGGVVGGGARADLGDWLGFLDVRYDFGLMSISDSPEDLDIKNRTFSVSAGLAYQFPRD